GSDMTDLLKEIPEPRCGRFGAASGEGAQADQLAADDKLMDLRGAVRNSEHTRITGPALQWGLFRQPIGAVKLDGEIGHTHRGLRRERLRGRRLAMAPDTTVEERERPVAEQSAGVDRRRHLGQHLLHELEARDRLAELRALARVGDADVERLLREMHTEQADV